LLEKEEYHWVILGARPQTPWVGFAEVRASHGLLRSRTTDGIFWGHAPKPPGSASPRFGLSEIFCEAELLLFASFSRKRRTLPPRTSPVVFCEAKQRFLLLFLEKEEYHSPKMLLLNEC
jgi:hypothetical protein